MNREVTMELLEKYGKEFVQDRANRVAQNAVVGKGVNAAATDSSVEREIANTFSPACHKTGYSSGTTQKFPDCSASLPENACSLRLRTSNSGRSFSGW